MRGVPHRLFGPGTARRPARPPTGPRRPGTRSPRRMLAGRSRSWSAAPGSISARCSTGSRRFPRSTRRFATRSARCRWPKPTRRSPARTPAVPRRLPPPTPRASPARSRWCARPGGGSAIGRRSAPAASATRSRSTPRSCCRHATGSTRAATAVSRPMLTRGAVAEVGDAAGARPRPRAARHARDRGARDYRLICAAGRRSRKRRRAERRQPAIMRSASLPGCATSRHRGGQGIWKERSTSQQFSN